MDPISLQSIALPLKGKSHENTTHILQTQGNYMATPPGKRGSSTSGSCEGPWSTEAEWRRMVHTDDVYRCALERQRMLCTVCELRLECKGQNLLLEGLQKQMVFSAGSGI